MSQLLQLFLVCIDLRNPLADLSDPGPAAAADLVMFVQTLLHIVVRYFLNNSSSFIGHFSKNRNLRFATALLLSLLEELFSTTQLNFLYFLVELLVKFLLSGTSPLLILFTTVQLISFDISSHYSTSLYSPIEKCCTPAYKGDTKDDTSKLSIFLHRDRSVSASESR